MQSDVHVRLCCLYVHAEVTLRLIHLSCDKIVYADTKFSPCLSCDIGAVYAVTKVMLLPNYKPCCLY